MNLDIMLTYFASLYQQSFAAISGIDMKVVYDRRCCNMLGPVGRKKSYFQRVQLRDPTDVIILACHLFHDWAKMQRNAF